MLTMQEIALTDTSPDELAACTAAAAAGPLSESTLSERAAMLEAVAAALDAEAADLVGLAAAETGLGEARLTGEVARTTGQLRMFAELTRDGGLLEAIIDTADRSATPPRPDVRRMLHPVGPVAVYAASNFPFAFSVAGGDTASALAAGCPVIVKAHRGHQRLSARVADLVSAALAGSGAPEGCFALVSGRAAGEALVVDPRIKAAGFTGSVQGGRALFDRASAEREDPIPFYGELGSINPVIVTRAAAAQRVDEIARGLVGSFTLGVGQFCTKPGVVLVPADSGIEPAIAEILPSVAGGRMLTGSIQESFDAGISTLGTTPGVTLIARGSGAGTGAVPHVYGAAAPTLLDHAEALLTECFGPVCLLVRYDDEEQLTAALDVLPGSLTVTVQGAEADQPAVAGLLPRLREVAGRVIWNDWPTGVAVNRAMHHGGPWPATTGSLHTSVGGTAVRRFQRPVAYQDVPDDLLPPGLRAANPLGIPRTVNGVTSRAR